jgi:hypothetical protein
MTIRRACGAIGKNEPLQIFKHKGLVHGALFNRDESRILTWSEDGTVRLWAIGKNEPNDLFKRVDNLGWG